MAVPTTEVTGRQTDIPGLLIFDVTSVGDERGWFQEKYHKAKLVAAGLPENFNIVQNSVAFNRKGTTKGFHSEPWDKYVSIVSGKAFAAFVDFRAGDSFGKVVTVELTPTTAVYLPKGIGNSYQCLEDLYYLYSVNAHWSEAAYTDPASLFVNVGDPAIGIDWPIPLDQAILSERDKNHPLLSDIKPLEV
jgi:dTDP-4-dehydrorhamnose 3,5-epimerase